jgi:multidrug resistance efflux pump
VRIEIDDADRNHPLYAGLSATVKVDTENQSGARLADEDEPPQSEKPSDRANIEHVAASAQAN